MDTRKIKYPSFCNVRTMFEISKSNQIAKELEANRTIIMKLNETRWNGCEKSTFQNGTKILNSGKIKEGKSTNTEWISC